MAIRDAGLDGDPTLTIEIRYDLVTLKKLLDGNWAKLDEVTAKTLHEMGHAILTDEPNRIEELESKVAELEAQLNARGKPLPLDALLVIEEIAPLIAHDKLGDPAAWMKAWDEVSPWLARLKAATQPPAYPRV